MLFPFHRGLFSSRLYWYYWAPVATGIWCVFSCWSQLRRNQDLSLVTNKQSYRRAKDTLKDPTTNGGSLFLVFGGIGFSDTSLMSQVEKETCNKTDHSLLIKESKTIMIQFNDLDFMLGEDYTIFGGDGVLGSGNLKTRGPIQMRRCDGWNPGKQFHWRGLQYYFPWSSWQWFRNPAGHVVERHKCPTLLYRNLCRNPRYRWETGTGRQEDLFQDLTCSPAENRI